MDMFLNNFVFNRSISIPILHYFNHCSFIVSFFTWRIKFLLIIFILIICFVIVTNLPIQMNLGLLCHVPLKNYIDAFKFEMIHLYNDSSRIIVWFSLFLGCLKYFLDSFTVVFILCILQWGCSFVVDSFIGNRNGVLYSLFLITVVIYKNYQ